MPTPAPGHPPDTAIDSEIHALERMLEARCKQIESMARSARVKGPEMSREQDFQMQAFAERRAQALQQVAAGIAEPRNARVARLERLLEALECSRDFFRSAGSEHDSCEEQWAVLIR